MLEIQINYDLGKTLESGQVFRQRRLGPNTFELHAKNRVCTVTQVGDILKVDGCANGDEDAWRTYFTDDTPEEVLAEMMHGNRILREAYSYSKGIRFLKQDPFECLISLIISQQKRIPQIQDRIEALCKACGKQLPDGSHAFPEPHELTYTVANSLRLGYRAPYVAQAAYAVAKGIVDVYGLMKEHTSYQRAMVSLQTLYGVGPKVAKCVALFSLGFTNAFPIDTHIQKILELPEMRTFLPDNYGEYAGYIQQYLFYWSINNGL